ncbi:tripartite motif-containing protein 16-like [Megalobrama amblycephala]|uniref:tripartite motif-containing protein 16-like n=1 Tax=Megalobrama amblycephala TaxID=75352 RepID=UPI002013CBE5|nr:tripartite motif-containing protein 16-like [Megalobrama amblycephala]
MDRAERIQDGDLSSSDSKWQIFVSPAPRNLRSGSVSSVSSHLSMKSNWSKYHPLNFNDEGVPSEHDYNLRSESVSPVPSDCSMDHPLNFKDGKMQPSRSKMAEGRILVDQDEFLCPVCLDLLKDPVTIPCGHSYCKSCITDCWDQEDQKRVYSCPQCRQTFSPRPALAKNTMLAEVVEKLKKRKRSAYCYAGAGDVQCDVCTGRKHKAVKSCLVCLESYCQTHFDRHEEFHSRKPHKVTEATGRLQEMICQKHDKLLEVFCRTDQKCICVLCIDEHKNHNTVSAAAQRTEKQHQLKETQRWFQQRIQQREKDLQQLREAVKSHKVSLEKKRTFTNIVPRTRNDFLQYSHQFTLDLNTVNKHLRLSERNRLITYTDTELQPYPDHPDRFNEYQVLCRESVSGRCYWEVEWSGPVFRGVCISVSYKRIKRKGRGYECWFGYNDQSWSLICSSSSYSFIHNNIETKLPVKPISRRIGVYVDHSAGTLSFYSVSGDTMILIHTVQTTFTQPLYPGFWVYRGSVKLSW